MKTRILFFLMCLAMLPALISCDETDTPGPVVNLSPVVGTYIGKGALSQSGHIVEAYDDMWVEVEQLSATIVKVKVYVGGENFLSTDGINHRIKGLYGDEYMFVNTRHDTGYLIIKTDGKIEMSCPGISTPNGDCTLTFDGKAGGDVPDNTSKVEPILGTYTGFGSMSIGGNISESYKNMRVTVEQESSEEVVLKGYEEKSGKQVAENMYFRLDAVDGDEYEFVATKSGSGSLKIKVGGEIEVSYPGVSTSNGVATFEFDGKYGDTAPSLPKIPDSILGNYTGFGSFSKGGQVLESYDDMRLVVKNPSSRIVTVKAYVDEESVLPGDGIAFSLEAVFGNEYHFAALKGGTGYLIIKISGEIEMSCPGIATANGDCTLTFHGKAGGGTPESSSQVEPVVGTYRGIGLLQKSGRTFETYNDMTVVITEHGKNEIWLMPYNSGVPYFSGNGLVYRLDRLNYNTYQFVRPEGGLGHLNITTTGVIDLDYPYVQTANGGGFSLIFNGSKVN